MLASHESDNFNNQQKRAVSWYYKMMIHSIESLQIPTITPQVIAVTSQQTDNLKGFLTINTVIKGELTIKLNRGVHKQVISVTLAPLKGAVLAVQSANDLLKKLVMAPTMDMSEDNIPMTMHQLSEISQQLQSARQYFYSDSVTPFQIPSHNCRLEFQIKGNLLCTTAIQQKDKDLLAELGQNIISTFKNEYWQTCTVESHVEQFQVFLDKCNATYHTILQLQSNFKQLA